MPETEEERAARKRREAEERRAKETPEERAARKAKEAERAKETPEERAARKAREAERAKETPEERAARKAKEAERAKETPEEREARKRREAEERRAKETPEERAARKAREAERAKETPEEREERKRREAERAKETPEEREARKRKEAEERRAKETPEERAARKAKEAERAKETPEQRAARKAREAEEAAAKQRQREERESRPVIHKQAAPSAQSPTVRSSDDKQRAAEKKPEMKPVQAVAPQKAKADEDEGDDYDDDDFEEVFETDQLADAIRATEAENARLRAEQLAAQQQPQGGKGGAASGSRGGKAAEQQFEGKSRAGLDVDSLTRQKHRAQFEKDIQRATALRRLVDLDEARFTICDITPQSQYEVFLRRMAATATVKGADGKETQVSVAQIASATAQAPEQRNHVEIQAERVNRKTRAMQAPDDLGLFPEAQAARQQGRKGKGAAGDGDADADANNKAGEGSDAEGGGGASPSGGDKKKKAKARVTGLDKRRVDTAALGAFMGAVFPAMRAILDENDMRFGGGAEAASPTTQRAATKHAFTQGQPLVMRHAAAAGREALCVAYSQLAPQYFAVAHGPADEARAGEAASTPEWRRAAAFDGLVLLWNTSDTKRPDKVLVAPGPIADVCLSPTRAFVVYAALRHGAVCVWDLREPEGAHGGSAVTVGLRAPSYTSGWSAADLHTAPLRRILVSGYNSATGQRNTEEAEQAVTLDEAGGISYWMLSVDDASVTASSDHHDAGGGGGGAGGSGGLNTGGLKASGSFNLSSPQRRRAAAAAASATEADLGRGLNANVHLYRAATLSCLEDTRAINAAKKSAGGDDYYGSLGDSLNAGPGGSGASHRFAAVTVDMDLAPTDATHLLVAGSAAVHHVSRFGSITAPSSYAGPAPSPVTAVASCPTDSRLLLVGYDNGALRLFLRDDGRPALSVHLSAAPIVSVRWSTSRRWIAFALDAEGALHVLDLAAANKAKPAASVTAPGGSAGDRYTAFGVSYDERETRLAIGHADGIVEVHTLGLDAVLGTPISRNERWL